jgi:UDP-3-O-[3-hydroxymyristoyl] glucosamine N-acyltransferase
MAWWYFMAPITVEEVVSAIGCDCVIIGDREATIHRPSPIESADPRSITFCNRAGEQGRELMSSTEAAAVITGREHEEFCRWEGGRAFILVDDPRLAFARVVDRFFNVRWPTGISELAKVGAGAKVGGGVFIGPFCNVGDGVEIGEGTRLEGSVIVHDGVRIGRNVVIRAGAVLGTDGYGFNRNPAGDLEKFPQIGGVVVADDVEIGSGTVVARGTISDTIIGKGTKIDNLCHIAHNVQIGQACMIIAGATLCGSVRIGDRSVIAPNAVVREKVSIGDNVLVGLGSVVLKDIPDDVVAFGNPARVVRSNR